MKHFLPLLLAMTLFSSCEKDEKIIEITFPNSSTSQENGGAVENVDIPVIHKLPLLHTDGRYLVNEAGEHVNLHGFWQTNSPWFNGGARNNYQWNNYDVDACLNWNLKQIDDIIAAGWKVDFMRLHMDSYWSLARTRPWPTDRAEYEDYDEELFKKYLDEVFVPIVEHCISKGLYVLLKPGYDAPDCIGKGDNFYRVLYSQWKIMSSHPKLCNNMDVMFEILNEPRSIKDANGVVGGNDDSHNKALTEYMQSFVDLIRVNAKNIIWVPGTGYQSQYAGYAKYKINDDNYGFAVHCYPGWYGSDAEKESAELGGAWGGGFESFKSGWDAQITPAANIAPILITEMDWAPESYGKSWGKSVTGEAGGHGFGANFKWLVDNLGNAGYILFTDPWDLADFPKYGKENLATNYWNDPRGCPWQIYHWYKDYAEGRIQPASADDIVVGGVSDGKLSLQKGGSKFIIANAKNGTKISPVMTGTEITVADASVAEVKGNKLVALKSGKTKVTVKALGIETSFDVEVEAFNPFDFAKFNPNIWETGSFNQSTHELVTGQYGFGGWEYSPGIDISSYKKLVCVLGEGSDMSCSPSFRIFDGGGYWDGAYEASFTGGKAVINISGDMDKSTDNKPLGKKLDPTNITIVGIWTTGGKPIVIEDIYLE
ncbi:MAG: glycoside hydrolase family 5 protein [Bacteroidales bacterium]|nr:glycoside hydrolase family 5 protein [Bacteroidales bacterium]